MSEIYFIAGTNTGIGKTYCTLGLLKAFQLQKNIAIAMKPLATGAEIRDGQRCNEDALLLQQQSSLQLAYEVINPYLYSAPLSPHIAARMENQFLNVSNICDKIEKFLQLPADVYLLEGVGGWHVPINENHTMADVVLKLNAKVILVVGMELGCINHAILTQRAMQMMQLSLVGWVANCHKNNSLISKEIISTITHWIKAPCIGAVPFNENVSDYVDLNLLN